MNSHPTAPLKQDGTIVPGSNAAVEVSSIEPWPWTAQGQRQRIAACQSADSTLGCGAGLALF
jgi:hypothetical protein